MLEAASESPLAPYRNRMLLEMVLERAKHLRPEFMRLVRQWEAACAHLSSTGRRVRHPAFRHIVAMGRPAIPLLLERLTRGGGDWDVALHEITGENPVPRGREGRMAHVAAAWLAWGARRGYRR
jgi:hypothetical protein